MTNERQTLYCDCCGTEGMASLDSERLIIRTKRHGTNHVITIRLDSLLKLAQNSRQLETARR